MTKAPLAAYPALRLRRLRQADWIRRLVRETVLTPSDLIWSMVVHEGEGQVPVGSMPGVSRLSVKDAAKAAKEARDLGIPAIAVFPHIDGAKKDAAGTLARDPDGLVARAVKAMKDAAPEVGVMCDVALDPFTEHGHDGVVEGGRILNDATIERLVEQGLAQAKAGCDILAPSDMMDGRVGVVRRVLDEAGFTHVPIMSYAAKFASGLYGPFREAAQSTPQFGDRRGYQMDPANAEEALREVALDIEEGADIVMVKPALPYLDLVHRVKERFAYPVAAYHVSGEYSMVKAAAARGWIDETRVVDESLLAIRRAGADIIITYFARDVARRRS